MLKNRFILPFVNPQAHSQSHTSQFVEDVLFCTLTTSKRANYMIRAILIDDEQECLNSLAFDLSQYCPEIEILDICQGGKKGIKSIHKHKPDMVFLDIDMPIISGFDLLELIGDIYFSVVFTTAYDKYALKAFKISATDYLLKPIDKGELKAAIKKVEAKQLLKSPNNQVAFLLDQLKALDDGNVKKIALQTFEGTEFINLKDIIYCEADGAYSHVHTTDGGKLYISKTLRYLEEALCDYHFFRTHNSYIVNTNYMKKYVKADGGFLLLNNGKQVKVSRSKKEKLVCLFDK